ncbi:capsule assembly Wzi family protein [Alteromonas sp. a30]|uniref:capsule assembly Wzi family protein n=1 Tax=Alteromonas sp. a30 TaxID=2730917 RepID=UPI002280040B|nr:capsule assembly Wzi family protein [Alteromonas sp. a30]MCY7295759.1 hypothetical protein [Alteromonas sp. a30]
MNVFNHAGRIAAVFVLRDFLLPMQRNIIASLLIAAPLFSASVAAQGISPYLPLKMAPEVEAHIEKVLAITPSAPLSKPYKATDILTRLELIKHSHPLLFSRVSAYLARYKTKIFVANLNSEIAASNDTTKSLPNQRGLSAENQYQIAGSAYAFINPYLYAAVGAQYSDDKGLEHHSTHIGFGFEYAQVEVGFREHWFSPFQDSAMLVSTNAKTSPSITISNATPITGWDFRYEIFYSELERVEGIRLGEEIFPGKPRHAGLHISFSPIDNLTIGLNRTLQFGGGKRSVDFGDFFEALFDPSGKDNIDGTDGTDPNFEFGNQQASITAKYNFNLGIPISVYAEYAGEDTVNRSNFSLGNNAVSLGVYLPMLTDDIAVRYEFSDWTTAWYVHHLYQQGYTNEGNVLGHWGGDNRTFNDDTPAQAHSFNVNWNLAPNQILDVTLRATRNQDNTVTNYQTAYEIQAEYSYATSQGFWGVGVYAGRDVFGDNFSRVSGFYRW